MVKKTKKQNGGSVSVPKDAKVNLGGEPPKKRWRSRSLGRSGRSGSKNIKRSSSFSGTPINKKMPNSVGREVHPFGEPNKVGKSSQHISSMTLGELQKRREEEGTIGKQPKQKPTNSGYIVSDTPRDLGYMSVENMAKKAKDTEYMSVESMTKKAKDAGYMSFENMAKKNANYMVVDPSKSSYMTAEANNTNSGYIYTIPTKLTDSEYMTAEAIKQPNSNFDANKYLLGKGNHDNTFGSRAQRFKKIQTASLRNEDTYIKLFGPDMGPKILHSFGNKTQNEIKQIQNTLSNKNSQSLTTKQAQDFHNLVIQKEKLKTISINNKQEQLVKYFLEEGNRIKTNGTKKSRRINRLLTADGKLNDNIFNNQIAMQKLFGVAQLGDKAVSIANIKNNKNKNALKRAIQTAILRIKGESEA